MDELRYLPLPGEAASALFQVVSQRYLKTSIVLTANRGVASCGGSSATPPSPQPCSTPSSTDQSRSVVLNLDGESYRLRDHHAHADTLRQAATGTRQPLQ